MFILPSHNKILDTRTVESIENVSLISKKKTRVGAMVIVKGAGTAMGITVQGGHAMSPL